MADEANQDTFLNLKKVEKKDIWKLWILIPLRLKKVSWVALLATTNNKNINHNSSNKRIMIQKVITVILRTVENGLSDFNYFLL